MAIARKVSPQAQTPKFTECLSPVVLYFRIIGYPLNYKQTSKIVRALILVNCFAMLAFDAWVRIDDMQFLFKFKQNFTENNGIDCDKQIFNNFAIAEILNRTVLVTSVHVIFVWLCLFGTWSRLWKRITLLETFNLNCDVKLLHRAIIAGFFINAMVKIIKCLNHIN